MFERLRKVFQSKNEPEFVFGSGLTPITLRAKQKLTDWGLSDVNIKLLQEFTRQFEYGRVKQRVERLSDWPVLVYGGQSGKEMARIQWFFDNSLGWMHGQCGDLTAGWAAQINLSGVLEELNNEMAGSEKSKGRRLTAGWIGGYSKTHFRIDSGGSHVWNALYLVEKKNRLVDLVYVDASFQKIMTPKESGYLKNNEVIETIGKVRRPHQDVSMGLIDFVAGEVVKPPGWAILGMSEDKNYAYGIGFARCVGTDLVLPVLDRINESGEDETFLVEPYRNKLWFTSNVVDLGEFEEVQEILNAANFNYELVDPSDYDDWDFDAVVSLDGKMSLEKREVK